MDHSLILGTDIGPPMIFLGQWIDGSDGSDGSDGLDGTMDQMDQWSIVDFFLGQRERWS